MPAKTVELGPGLITVGEVGAPVDFSCQLNNGQVEWDKDKDDDQTVLCGEVVPGSTTYTATLSGNLFEDLNDPAGIVKFSWDHKGEAHPFTFTPNTDAGATVTGTVVVDPITVGGDEMGAKMATDFEWDIVGEPTLAITASPGTFAASEPVEADDVAA